MRPPPLTFTAALGAALTLAVAPGAVAQTPPTEAPAVEPEAAAALSKMSAYLRGLNTFAMKAETSLDVVTQEGQRIQLDGTTNYKVRRGAGFVIDVETSLRHRTYLYDGKVLTVAAPALGFYATVPAPPTNLETIEAMEQKFGIPVPIADLFLWNEQGAPAKLESGFVVGSALIDGVKTDQYAFRQGMIDWQVWIQQGAQPLPRKLVIIDRSDLAHPAYVARLNWTTNPSLTAQEFVYAVPAAAAAIRLSVLDNGSK